jgi:tetratricopeptide (TPR) repeat protein
MRQPATKTQLAPTRAATTAWVPWVILGSVCALVIGFFAWSARPGWLEIRTWRADDAYYNQLVRGFRAGQLNLKTEVPAGFAQLADPFDPVANINYREADGHPLWDLSYYHRKLYLYFGVTPALVLFWPYAALTGHYLGHKDAVVVFCASGFLASAGLLCLVWRRYFPEVSLVVVAAGTLALGLAGFTPIILPRANVHEVAISCGYALTMLALLALLGACYQPHEQGRWLAAASLAYGLAVGARPNLLFGAVILLVPVAQAWREGRRQKEVGRSQRTEVRAQRSEARSQRHATPVLPSSTAEGGRNPQPANRTRVQSQIANRKSQILVPLLAAIGPITCIGLGLMLYNALRFDNPLEFGVHYQLAGVGAAPTGYDPWSLHYLGFNSWVYFLAPARWSPRFPFVQDIQLPPFPAGYGNVDHHPFGMMVNIPVVWLAVAAPLAWRGRSADVRCRLRGFLVAVALVFATSALTLGFFRAAAERYEWEFCPALVLLAIVSILGLERVLADRKAWRRAARWTWSLLLAFSLAFNLLASAINHAEYHAKLGSLLVQRGHIDQAIAHCQKALALQPDDAGGRVSLGDALLKKGQTDEAIGQYQAALRLEPDLVDAHNGLGVALDKKGQTDEAIRHLQEVIRLIPDHANAHYNLGVAFYQQGRTDEAIRQFQEVIRLTPDHAGAHNNLGTAFGLRGQTDEAIRQFQEALRLKPDYADARRNLDAVLATKARSSPPPGAATNR